MVFDYADLVDIVDSRSKYRLIEKSRMSMFGLGQSCWWNGGCVTNADICL